MDSVGEVIESAINDALRYPFKFHGVNKIVVRLGASPIKTPDYIEMEGVGKKQFPEFNPQAYLALKEAQRQECLIAIAKSVFQWLTQNFEDADFARSAAERLNWKLGQ